MFRALGQVMHLVVDASVPEHTRDDAHAGGTILREALRRRRAGNYEYWVSDQHTRAERLANAAAEAAFRARFLSNPIGFDSALFNLAPPAGETVARVPIARLIDTDRYEAESLDANLTLDPAIGLAEFSNANFFSEDTLAGQFPFPRRADLTVSPRVAPRADGVRRYFSKPAGQGLPTNVALAECGSERSIARWMTGRTAPYPCVDEAVWEETASHTLPRAVGYARGVLDYFFRGALNVQRVYSESGNAFIRIENAGDEDLEGVFEIYGRPHAGTPEERRERSGLVNGGEVTTLAARSVATFPVALLPVTTPTASQILVFRGRIGREQEGAVAAQVFAVQHVVVTQDGNTAFMRAICAPTAPTATLCQWQPTREEITGELLTGGDAPVIAQVWGRWEPLGQSVELEVDGVPVPGQVWQRSGDEPDPTRYLLRARPTGSTRLRLMVQTIDGNVTSLEMAHFTRATTSARKQALVSRPFAAVSDRSVDQVLVTTQPPFRTVSLAGYANPTDVTQDRFGHPLLLESLTVVERPTFADVRYKRRWIDFAQVFPLDALASEVAAVLHALSWGPPPAPPWEAVVDREYAAEELEFLHTFITGDLSATRFTMVALNASGT